MTSKKVTGAITITLGNNDHHRRRAALHRLSQLLDGDKSISRLLCQLADAADSDLEMTAQLFQEMKAFAAVGYVAERDEELLRV